MLSNQYNSLSVTLICVTKDLRILEQEEEAKRKEILLGMGVTPDSPVEDLTEPLTLQWAGDSILKFIGLSTLTADKGIKKNKVHTVQVQPKVHPEADVVYDLEKGAQFI